jgi:hypothetical protein
MANKLADTINKKATAPAAAVPGQTPADEDRPKQEQPMA